MKSSIPSDASWVEVPPDSDFSIHNIPFGIFRTQEASVQAGVAIGEYVLDLNQLHAAGYFNTLDLPPAIFNQSSLNAFLALGRDAITSVRKRVIELLSRDNDELQRDKDLVNRARIRQSEVLMLRPVDVRNYSDFYSSEEHARNVGSMFRDPKNALLPNWKHLPVGYHGRASSIYVSGTNIYRPNGQVKKPDQDNPVFGPSEKLDFELETAFVTCRETRQGDCITVAASEEVIAGFVLFNDWSARDIQQWEYVPLGPFLGKNFASSVSPWLVTLDALEPFRSEGPIQEPEVLPYLRAGGKRNFDIVLEATIQMRSGEEVVICRTNMKYLYWSIHQQLAHHTINGCSIQVGDMYASGTISGPSPGSYGSLLELSWNGKKPLTMPDGTVRTFLEDGDSIILRAHASKGGIRVGFGECRGTILPPLNY